MLLSGDDVFYILKTCLISSAQVKLAWAVMKLSFYPSLPYFAIIIGKSFEKSAFNFGIFVNQSNSPCPLLCSYKTTLF